MKILICILLSSLFFPLISTRPNPIAPNMLPTLPDVNLSTPIFSQEYDTSINAIAWSPDGKRLAVNYEFTTEVWLLENSTRQISFTSDMMFPPYTVFFTTDGSVIVAASDYAEVQGFDSQTGAQIYAISRNENAYDIYSVPLFYVGDKALILGTQDVRPYPIDLRTGDELFKIHDQMGHQAYAFWSQDGTRLFTYDFGGFHAWDGVTGIPLYSLPEVDWIELSPDSHLFLHFRDSHLELYESATGTRLSEFSLDTFIQRVIWNPVGNHFAVLDNDGQVILLYTEGSQHLLTDSQRQLVEFSPDGQYLITIGQDERLHLWETETYTEVIQLPSGLQNKGWTPDGSAVLVWHPDEQAILLYETSSWTATRRWPAPGDSLIPDASAAWSPDGSMAAISWYDTQTSGGIIEVFSLN
ncbi:MAG: WD40 repeat domain-containing protein [Anaerolineae bacterium]|nr:WD40 repeat domain-containing protein [Anaerolineae bacterium]